MKDKTIKKATPEKYGVKVKKGDRLVNTPKIPKTEEYLERALVLQKDKIESQRIELSRMNNIYMREVRNTSTVDALKFFLKVVRNKITNKFKK